MSAQKKAPLFVCGHGKRDDEDCLHCEIVWEERMIAVAENQLTVARLKLARLRAALNATGAPA